MWAARKNRPEYQLVWLFSTSLVPYSSAVSRLRRPFLSDRFFFVTVRLLDRAVTSDEWRVARHGLPFLPLGCRRGPVAGRGRQEDEPELEGAARQAARHAAAALKHYHPARRVTRPARGAVFLKISLTRHRAFRDGYRPSEPSPRKAGGQRGSSCGQTYETALPRSGPRPRP